MVKRYLLKTIVVYKGDEIERTVITSGPTARRAKETSSLDLRSAFMGVTKIDGCWWTVCNIFGEPVAVEEVAW